MKHLPLAILLTLCLPGLAPHQATAGSLPTDIETPVGKFERMTPDVWITEPDVIGEAAITWKQVRADAALIELHDMKSDAILMFALKDKVIAFVQKVSARMVSPDGDSRLAVFAADRFFVEGSGKGWIERPNQGPTRKWDEMDRDEWSVYLHSNQGDESLQLDLYQAKAITSGGRTCATPCERKLLTAGPTSPITRITMGN